MENLKRTSLKEAADLIEGHASILSRGRTTVSATPLLIESLYAAVYILRHIEMEGEKHESNQ